MTKLSKDYITDICKMGQGADCCKYLGADKDGITCLKLDLDCKAFIDAKTDMIAKADNCEGVNCSFIESQ